MGNFGGIRFGRRVLRRWWVVAVLIALGAGLAVATAPSAAERLRSSPGSASTELVFSPDATTASTSQARQQLELASRVAAQPEVADAAAERNMLLRSDLFSDTVTVALDEEAGSIVVTATTGDDSPAAVEVAAAYAQAAADYIAATTGISLRPIGTPVAAPRTTERIPSDPYERGALGALAGLVLGVLLAGTIAPGRDGRLHDRRSLERAYRSSVLIEIPRTRARARYAGYVAFLARPTGTVAEAYRVLRCAVLNRGKQGEAAPRVIAVTSPNRGDGRSSVARNLAAALAESGRRVLLVDCDFGHPTAHYGVGIQPNTGLSDLLAAADPGARLAEVVQQTETPGVLVLSIGTRGGREPGQLASALPQVLTVARRLVDVIVLDSEPLACAGDALDALEIADAVLIVAKAGRTHRGAAKQTADLLERCGTVDKVAGLVLIGTSRETEVRTPYLITRPAAEYDNGTTAVPAWDDSPAELVGGRS
ncbi:CpsD/CapB family tyrosine-protein kinase [Sporichthya polymorpha]|uniref:CpsD/CapB family tyrosine-protein kinase n=1 Tax=Sporichthya polymorpha TaxID=35751 RepID=UPI0003A06EE6|nr:CpsD/CapB family tyrosine-protein kinase [Sporichthya polymorpha]